MSSNDLHITYLVWGFPVKSTTMLQIPAETKAYDLSTIISDKLDLEGLPFALHKVCRDVPEGVEYLEEVVGVNTFPVIWPNGQLLSDIFSESLGRDHLHFVVDVMSPGWMAQRVQYIELSCWMWPGNGGAVKDVIRIKIPRKGEIRDLKASIKEAHQSLETVELQRIQLYDVSIPTTELEEGLCCFTPDKAELEWSAQIYQVFPSPLAQHIHVVVHVRERNLMEGREEYYKCIARYFEELEASDD